MTFDQLHKISQIKVMQHSVMDEQFLFVYDIIFAKTGQEACHEDEHLYYYVYNLRGGHVVEFYDLKHSIFEKKII